MTYAEFQRCGGGGGIDLEQPVIPLIDMDRSFTDAPSAQHEHEVCKGGGQERALGSLGEGD